MRTNAVTQRSLFERRFVVTATTPAGSTSLSVSSPAVAQLYMNGAGGVYSNLESSGLAGRFALGAEPLDWIKVEGSVLATGHDQACCSLALDATGWLTVLGAASGPRCGRGAGVSPRAAGASKTP